MKVRADEVFTVKSVLLGEEHYFNVPLVKPGVLFCRYLSFSLNQLLKRGFPEDLRVFLQECFDLVGGGVFYSVIRKESSNTFLVTPIKNLEVRIQPYLYINGFIVLEIETFLRSVLYGGC